MHFKELLVWQKSMELTKVLYKETTLFPKEEQFGLTSQMRRAVVSIPSNIAEGSKRGSRKDYLQFLRIADGSAAELETQLLLAQKLFPALSLQKSLELLSEVQRMLAGLMKRLSGKS